MRRDVVVVCASRVLKLVTMCRLFGFKSAVLSRAHRSLIAAENALSVQARAHRDGWGIGWFHGPEAYLLKSEAGADACDSFRRAADRLASQTLVVHVRKATVGSVNPLNVHPFRHGRWVFAHNGTLLGFDALAPVLLADTPPALREQILGQTDSEHLFAWLLGKLERAGIDPLGARPVDADHVGDVLHAALGELFGLSQGLGLDRPLVNFILTNGGTFVANRAGRELHLASQKRTCKDAATCPAEKICLAPVRADDRVNHLLVASERIGDEDLWEEVPENTLVTLSADFRLRLRPGAPT